jgi:hypothetical protein
MSSTTIATKGILGGLLSTKGFIVLEIEEIPIKRRRKGLGGDSGSGGVGRKIKKLRIKFYYNGKEYIEEKIVRDNLKVEAKNIEIEIIKNKPKIKFNFKEV